MRAASGELARGKLKNRIHTFLGNPLCRGVDELCTKQLESRCRLFAEMKMMKDDPMESNSENLELCSENFGLKTENDRLKKENNRLDCLLFYCSQKERGWWPSGDAARGSANALQRIAVTTG
jgi:hypothetical protein